MSNDLEQKKPDVSLCDRCGIEKPANETDTCEACGAQICNDCRPAHEEECCG
jgi:ribosomal protein L37E